MKHKDCRPRRRKVGHEEYDRAAYRALRKEVVAGEHGGCVVCGTFDDLTVEHEMPVALGGRFEDGWHVKCRSHNSAGGSAVRYSRRK